MQIAFFKAELNYKCIFNCEEKNETIILKKFLASAGIYEKWSVTTDCNLSFGLGKRL